MNAPLPDHDSRVYSPPATTVRPGEVDVVMKRPEVPDWGGEQTELGSNIYCAGWDSEDGEVRLWVGPYAGGLVDGWAVSVETESGVDVVMRCTPDQAVEWAKSVAWSVHQSREEALDAAPDDWRSANHGRPFDVAYNIVNQLGDLWEVPVDRRQETNDRAWVFATTLIEQFDSGLRDAIQALAADWRSQPHDPDSTAITVMRHCGAQLASALADHPARGALEAADPLPGSRPLLDRKAVQYLLMNFRSGALRDSVSGPPGSASARLDATADAVLELARPMPTRQQLAMVLDKHRIRTGPSITCSCGGWTERPVGSLLWTPDEFARHQTEAVLALLGGDADA